MLCLWVVKGISQGFYWSSHLLGNLQTPLVFGGQQCTKVEGRSLYWALCVLDRCEKGLDLVGSLPVHWEHKDLKMTWGVRIHTSHYICILDTQQQIDTVFGDQKSTLVLANLPDSWSWKLHKKENSDLWRVPSLASFTKCECAGSGDCVGEEEGELNGGLEVGVKSGGDRVRGPSVFNTTLTLVACSWESWRLATWSMSPCEHRGLKPFCCN